MYFKENADKDFVSRIRRHESRLRGHCDDVHAVRARETLFSEQSFLIHNKVSFPEQARRKSVEIKGKKEEEMAGLFPRISSVNGTMLKTFGFGDEDRRMKIKERTYLARNEWRIFIGSFHRV